MAPRYWFLAQNEKLISNGNDPLKYPEGVIFIQTPIRLSGFQHFYRPAPTASLPPTLTFWFELYIYLILFSPTSTKQLLLPGLPARFSLSLQFLQASFFVSESHVPVDSILCPLDIAMLQLTQAQQEKKRRQ
ncbi:hypothetical protein ACTXT7_014782 [Hymenolepis weldensis]